MTPNQRREEISKAYVAAVAARCGYKLGTWSQDDDCLDITIGAAGVLGKGTLASPKLDIQLKASSDQSHDREHHIAWQLLKSHYDILRADSCIPRILVVVMLPEDLGQSVEHSADQLILRRCGYWCSLKGNPDIEGEQQSTVVEVPRCNMFSPEALRELMEQIGRGEEP